MRQPPSARVYRMRSWRRLRRPCQNSMLAGERRKPPQRGGQGTSRPSKRASASAKRASSTAREATTSLCVEAHAPIWLGRGRWRK